MTEGASKKVDILFRASDLRWPETTAERYARVVATLYTGSAVPTATVAGHEGVSTNGALDGIRQAVRLGLIQRVGGHRGGGWAPARAKAPAA